MKQLSTKQSAAQKRYDSELHSSTLRHYLYELLQLTFIYAKRALEDTAKLRPQSLKQEFSNAFEPYQRTSQVIENLEESGRRIIEGWWVDSIGFTYRDLFLALTPETQDLLKQQGVNYEPTI